MWTDDHDNNNDDHDNNNDDSEMEVEMMYEDVVSMLSGIYYSAQSSFGFCVGLEF